MPVRGFEGGSVKNKEKQQQADGRRLSALVVEKAGTHGRLCVLESEGFETAEIVQFI